jgi:hypothetical protein
MGGEVIGAIFNIFKTDYLDELPDMQQFLETVVPDQWYPMEKLETCIEHIRKKDKNILNKIGQTWGHRAVEALGMHSNLATKSLVLFGFSQYKRQHRGTVEEVGTIVCKTDPAVENKIIISDYTVYRCDIYVPFLRTLVSDAGGKNVRCDHPRSMCSNSGAPFCQYEITWD